jgi:hypothetical protein
MRVLGLIGCPNEWRRKMMCCRVGDSDWDSLIDRGTEGRPKGLQM